MLDNPTIQKLRDLSIEEVAERLGLKVRNHKSLCPFHSDTRPSMTYNVRRNTYKCYVCDSYGGTIDLVMRMLHLKFADACKWLADANNIQTGQTVSPRITKPPAEQTADIRHLRTLMSRPFLNDEARRFLFDERKIKPEIANRLGLSSISTPVPMSGNLNGVWFNAPSLLIPYCDVDGNLISVQARYLGQDKAKPRFQFPKGARCGIFNLQILKRLEPGSILFVTEGVSDCLAVLSAGYPAIAIPSATLLKPSDAQYLKQYTLHIYPDCDAPGERLYLDLRDINPNITRHQLPDGFKDIGQYYAYQHKED